MDRSFAWIIGAALLVAASALGCSPKIGDACSTSTDCSAMGDRLCDTTQPGGYCTIFNCEPGTCPGDAVCVAFRTESSPAAGCRDPQGSSRFARTFCMANCVSDDDCRSGYVCEELNRAGNPWGAAVVERGDFNGAVCVVPASGAAVPEDAPAGVCEGYDGGFEAAAPPPDAGGDGAASDADVNEDAALDGGDSGVTTDAGDAAVSTDAGASDAEAGADAGTDAAGD
ncbi:MAG: hypothetical protein OZ921_21305 [Sorangiineae bacterium]|nr:hypothetical protein [Polyangiaceae bacterium]MEB2325067.1 hypothetical protein [Sorangiineae bacterium]